MSNYSYLSETHVGDFVVVEERPPSPSPSRSSSTALLHGSDSSSLPWNSTRIAHLVVIVGCIVITAAAILFSLFSNGSNSEGIRSFSGEGRNFTTSTTTMASPKMQETGDESYEAAKASALSTLDIGENKSPNETIHKNVASVPTYDHLVSLVNENKTMMVALLGTGTGFFVLIGIFFSVAMYQKHVRQLRAISLEKLAEGWNSNPEDIYADHISDDDDEEDLFLASNARS